MTVKGSDHLICLNPECGAEFKVIKKASRNESSPRCFCGSEMKHPYHSPELRVLNEVERNQAKKMLSLQEHSSPSRTSTKSR